MTSTQLQTEPPNGARTRGQCTKREVWTYLGIGKTTLEKLMRIYNPNDPVKSVKDGGIPHHYLFTDEHGRPTGHPYFTWAGVDAYVAARERSNGFVRPKAQKTPTRP
jgi:hypothetical protein